jgi:hypothetical protein
LSPTNYFWELKKALSNVPPLPVCKKSASESSSSVQPSDVLLPKNFCKRPSIWAGYEDKESGFAEMFSSQE